MTSKLSGSASAYISFEAIYESLKLRTDEAHQAFLRAHIPGNTRSVDFRQATLDVGLLAMARYSLAKPKNSARFFSAPHWLSDARGSLVEFIDEMPDEREFLFDSIYFSDDLKTQRRLGRIISAAVEPAGNYDDYEFAAGVATGMLAVKAGDN